MMLPILHPRLRQFSGFAFFILHFAFCISPSPQMALNEVRFWGILASGQPETMQAWGTIGMYEAREEANPIPQDSSPLNDACNESGLVATVIHHGPNAGVYWVYFTFYDGNGNVMGYVRGADGLLVAQYEYGPFGELLRATGPLSQTFNYLFSTKYHDWETGLYYYGHRYYNPTTGRWLSKDPVEERGGLNLYGFVHNDPVDFVDIFGLWKSRPWGPQHMDLTVNALNTALASIRDKPNASCKDKMAKILVEANEGQDSGDGYSDFARHFNHQYFKGETAQQAQQRSTASRNAYTTYLANEEISFYFIPECWERLKALGRLSHSWQDFYAHGIHTSRGFVDPMSGSPSNPGEFWPSSYNSWQGWDQGEHPNREEPVAVTSQRYSQAEAYTALRFRRMLDNWLASCKCLCQ